MTKADDTQRRARSASHRVLVEEADVWTLGVPSRQEVDELTRKARVRWSEGEVFEVPLPDGSRAFGQAIALMMKNVVYCALTERRATTLAQGRPELTPASVVARVALSREQLDFGAWTALGVAPLVCRKSDFGNERFAGKGYVGAKIFDAALAQDFLAAFHGLAWWDSLHDPKYFDAWLVSPERKPATVRLRGASSTR